MSRKTTQRFLFAAAALAVIFAFAACQNISYSKLSANYHFGRANSYFRENQYRKAITEYEATLKFNPNMTQAYRFLGESYKQLYKPGVESAINKELEAKTLAALNKALEIEPNNKDIIYSLGDMYDKLRKFPEAEKLYLRIIELEPEDMSNYYVVAEFYKRYSSDNKDIAKKAESMYLRRIETDPDNPQGYAYMATYLQESAGGPEELLKSYEKAAEFWQRRITLQPDSAEAWLALGVNQWSRSFRFQFLSSADRLRMANEALKSISKAIELDANYPEPYAWMGPLYKAVLAKLEPEKEARYNAEGDRYLEKFQELRKRAAERKKLEEELKK
ncbi:MAG: tetratricopeptide repeat protein [Candidatus Aminicenantes bacterium]|nr:tetratricopeptide repeat protein [Candidatus Aminicenantes bacterium]NLH75765.1 tetratricopeptide repeat protein [Acidobacteriota bacterium]